MSQSTVGVEYTRKSILSGKVHTVVIPLTREEFVRGFHRWKKEGWLIQNAFPTLTPDAREFIMTGITSEEWNSTFSKGE